MAKKRVKRQRRNIAAGFYDEDGYFHPIRASYDYSPSRAGEGRKRKKNPPRWIKAKAVRIRRAGKQYKVDILK